MRTKILLSATLFFMYAFVCAQIINVPGDYPTIQEGINAASQGDTVLVQPDTYPGNINFMGKEITVGSLYLTTGDANYIDQTIIDGGQNGLSVVTFENGETADAILIGFTVTNGYSSTSGGGIMCVYSNPSLQYLYITDNEAAYNGGGIICGAFASPSLDHVQITNNFAGGDGGGMYCYNNCNPSLQHIVISGNACGGGGGGIFCLENCALSIEEAFISNNLADNGGGILCAGNSNIEISEVTIEQNIVNYNGGGIFISEASPILTAVYIEDNSAFRGGGIFMQNSPIVSLNNSFISNNIITEKGGGIYATDMSMLDIQDCSIMENEAAEGGGLFYYIHDNYEDLSELILQNTNISNNLIFGQGRYGGAIIRKDNGELPVDVSIENCAFNNNIVATGAYGGLTIRGTSVFFEVINSYIQNNEVSDYTAGAGFQNGCSGSLYNCLFTSNIANTSGQEWNSGGVTVWGGAEVEFFNCTFVDNSAFIGSAMTIGASDASLVNSIVWDNDNNPIAVIDFNDTGSTLMIGQCDIEGGEASLNVGDLSEVTWVGTNLDEDPVFVGTGDNPFSLGMGSPCIDAGVPDTTGMELPESDLIGNYRVWDGDGDDVAVIDMGPYEYGAVGVGISVIPSEVSDLCVAYPNPFSNSITISYELEETEEVQLNIFNQMGQLVYSYTEKQTQGKQQLHWVATGQPDGIYYYNLNSDNRMADGKLVKVR